MWQDQCQTDYLLNIQSNSLKAIVQSTIGSLEQIDATNIYTEQLIVQSAIGSLEHIDATNTQESVA